MNSAVWHLFMHDFNINVKSVNKKLINIKNIATETFKTYDWITNFTRFCLVVVFKNLVAFNMFL